MNLGNNYKQEDNGRDILDLNREKTLILKGRLIGLSGEKLTLFAEETEKQQNTLGGFIKFGLLQTPSQNYDEAVAKFHLIAKIDSAGNAVMNFTTDEIQIIKENCIKVFNTETFLAILVRIAPNDLATKK